MTGKKNMLHYGVKLVTKSCTKPTEVSLQVDLREKWQYKKFKHALWGLCPSKHMNNMVKGKHNNELIVLWECHNECESDYAECI